MPPRSTSWDGLSVDQKGELEQEIHGNLCWEREHNIKKEGEPSTVPPVKVKSCRAVGYFFLPPPEAFFEALRGLTLRSSTLISTFTWVAKLQMPWAHFFAGAG